MSGIQSIPVLHLPINLGMFTADAASLSNSFYLTDINPSDYEKRSTFINSANQVAIDLIPLQGDKPSYRFANKVQEIHREQPAIAKSVIPMLKIYTEEELGIFKNIPLDTPFDVLKVSDIPRKVAELLNHYSSGYGWVSSSYGTYSTAGFSLLFNGIGTDAPAKYKVVKETSRLVVLQINHGVNQGIIYLTIDPTQVIVFDSDFIGKL